MDTNELLDLFDRLVGEAVTGLAELDDWGPSGERAGQYRHDVVADRLIVDGLRRAGLGVLSEESGMVTPPAGGGVTVVVDPVDGSTNGSIGLPWYASSLCAVDGAGPLAALVVNLATGLRYRAVRGHGARRDHSPLVVGGARSEPGPIGVAFGEAEPIGPSGCARLGDGIIAFSGPPPAGGGWRQFRVLGAAALDLCAVADGTLDGYADIDRAHGVWDYLGAQLICAEAGVEMIDWGGEELVVLDVDARRGPVAGATPTLRDELATLVGMVR